MFGIDTQEEMPESFLTDHAAWDGYIGDVWHKILSLTNFNNESRVVDIAPGSSIKLGAALAKFGYRGQLYIVDSSAEALAALKRKYADLLPQAHIHWLCGSLKEQAAYLPRHPDYLLGNHIIDDMILAASNAPHEHEKNFSWASAYVDAPTVEFQRGWQRLLTDPALLSWSKGTVEKELIEVIKGIAPRCLILNQYPSSTLYDHGMGIVNDHAFSILTGLKKAFEDGLAGQQHLQTLLNANKNFGNIHIGEHVLNAKYWMLWRERKHNTA